MRLKTLPENVRGIEVFDQFENFLRKVEILVPEKDPGAKE